MKPLEQGQIRPTVGLNSKRLCVHVRVHVRVRAQRVCLPVAQFDVAQPRRCRLVCWDLGGQRSLRALWETYFADADACLFVVDATAADRLEEACTILSTSREKQKQKQKRFRPQRTTFVSTFAGRLVPHCTMHHMPLLIVANKIDIVEQQATTASSSTTEFRFSFFVFLFLF